MTIGHKHRNRFCASKSWADCKTNIRFQIPFRAVRTERTNIEKQYNKFTDSIYGSRNSGLDKPLSLLTSALNGMAKHPAILKAVFRTLIAGILGVTALRGLGMVVNLLNGFKNLKSGKLTIDQSAGSDVMPVFVTNMGGGMGAAGNTRGRWKLNLIDTADFSPASRLLIANVR